jgi:calcineurin-like phosphoesterase family protein
MTIHFISDYHFGHRKIKDFCPWRPGATIDEHDEILIQNHNARVGKKDLVYILGDFSYKAGAEKTIAILKRLKGRKILISGNHDKDAHLMLQYGFAEVHENIFIFLTDSDGKKYKVFLSHYPYRPNVYDRLVRKFKDKRYLHKRIVDTGGWLLCGHTHARKDFNGPREIHIGVDAPHSNFAPIPHTKILEIIKRVESTESPMQRLSNYLKNKLNG